MNLPIETKNLYIPNLTEVAEVLNGGLKKNFENITVAVVDCPDLTQEPFTLACRGLGGKPALVEIGGPPYLLPLVQRSKLYNMQDIAKLINMDPAFIVGAGAGPFPFAGVNCEGILNLEIANGTVNQQTRISKVTGDGLAEQIKLPNSETRCALLANLLFSEGKTGKVIRVHAKKRIGNDDFIASIRKTLAEHYKDKIVGLGGTFLLKEGKAKQHVMPDFSVTPLNSDEDLNKWLHFYNMSAPLIAVGTLVTGEYDLDLRVQHFHSFSHHNEAGHYHIDTTPDTVEYLGYFTVAEAIHRIDRPISTHQFGRD
ncbi:hypothetical protein MML48_5g00017235 [Holotrichia oblita]|uniref:Uncharacterized protein n=1 Tax=Holotrichia oblita TaxID=644536 RepID=A0ACB9T303_HOLOL|nr:hypothetical protein MML48_5g00017235 [Holotrichia oblita]